MKRLISALVVVASAGAALAANDHYYLRSQSGYAWGATGENQAMDIAFGPGNWIDDAYETANLGAVFSANTDSVFIDGGDGNGGSFKSFIEANHQVLQDWVFNGGCLFLNAATWGESIDCGFGGVNLEYGYFGDWYASDPNHYILTGPAQPTATYIAGGSASHNRVTGPGLTVLSTDGFGDTSLADMTYGSGHVMFGGLTDPSFWYGDPTAALNVRANMFTYCPIPTPGAVGLLGLAGLTAARRRR